MTVLNQVRPAANQTHSLVHPPPRKHFMWPARGRHTGWPYSTLQSGSRRMSFVWMPRAKTIRCCEVKAALRPRMLSMWRVTCTHYK